MADEPVAQQPEELAEGAGQGPSAERVYGRTERLKEKNFFDELLRIRDEQRKKKEQAIWLIKGKELPWEINHHGKMQWYLHPSIEDVSLRTLMFYKQEIPAGSKSGRQKCQGGVIFHILEGKGFTILDGIKHPWNAGDVLNLPLREEGCVYQHFNTDPEKPVVMVACEPNLIDVLGVDKGSGFEELEDSPEYRKLQEQEGND
ncbi:MAG: hypothetical protein HY675_27590 [Chloroflexi bacterium]|nr:hypothetical protein [Chloroflexota bacterium]